MKNLLAALENPLGVSNITQLINKLIYYLQIVAVPIVAIMVLYAGFKIMTSEGDPKGLGDAKKIILYAAIGYGIILIGSGFVYIIKDILNVR